MKVVVLVVVAAAAADVDDEQKQSFANELDDWRTRPRNNWMRDLLIIDRIHTKYLNTGFAKTSST